MGEATAKYFDYMPRCGEALQARLGRADLATKIPLWRKHGTEDPDAVVTGCRNIAENALRILVDDKDAAMRFVDLIGYAEDEGLIDKAMACKFQEIRRLGNNGAHRSVKVIDAQMALELIDDVLRSLIVRFGIDEDMPPSVPRGADAIFVVRTEDEISQLSRRAKTAALISGDADIEREVRSAGAAARKQGQDAAEVMERLAGLLAEAKALNVDSADGGSQETAVLRERLFEECDEVVESVRQSMEDAAQRAVRAESRVDEILSEHDFIEKLLRGRGRATESQFEVMAFPRTSTTSVSILQIAGGAGTGKTLCLLAKLISDVSDGGQMSMFGERPKKALFVCFNKSLAGYVRKLLAEYPSTAGNIEVVHYDEYINQLVRNTPKDGFEHLRPYAQDVRYPLITEGGSRRYWKIAYDSDVEPILRRAMGRVAERHPSQKEAYYLDGSSSENTDWMLDELRWLEARYEDEREAAALNTSKDPYLRAARTGRGTKRRPGEEIRKIILEVWAEFRASLAAQGRYTIEQATKRLLKSNSLPSYDAIAIDEVQDFSMKSVQLLLKFRSAAKARVYLSGDENQKIYQRDFTWKELDSSVRGHTITLRENKRNSYAIRCFAERLNGTKCPIEDARNKIHLVDADEQRVVGLLRNIAQRAQGQTTALIGNVGHWMGVAARAQFPLRCPEEPGDVLTPGFYAIGELIGKGLEFDNVIVDYRGMLADDLAGEKRLRYVHFTRARQRLYIRYEGEPPELLRECYADFLK